MKSWKLDSLGGELRLVEVPVPVVRAGSVLIRVEASLLMSYLREYVAGELPVYSAPGMPFTPGGNCIGTIESVGPDVWHLKPGQRAAVSSYFVAQENVSAPGQFLLGVTAFGSPAKKMQGDWPDGTLAEYILVPAHLVTPLAGLDGYNASQLVFLTRYAVPYGGFVRGRLQAGETVVVNGASGAYGSAAVLLALALGAGNVLAVGRNRAALDTLASVGGKRVVPVPLTGAVDADADSIRALAGGGAHLALDMVGNAKDSNATMAVLNSLQRGGRHVLMGSMTGELPIPYLKLMANNLELIGNFMHSRDALSRLAAMVASGLLTLDAFVAVSFALSELPTAMEAASQSGSLGGVVITISRNN
jgi:alcohol dehydrogenase